MTARKWVAIALMAIGILTASVGIVGYVFGGGQEPAAFPTPTPSPSPTPDTSTDRVVREFYAQLGEAFQTNNQGFLFDHLHPEVVKLYGDPQCRAHLARIVGNRSFEVVQVHPTAPWNYGEKEGRQIIIPDAIQVDVIQRLDDQGTQSATHLVIGPERVQWFTDCGDPTV
ncbi:MAG: hypothetical protein ACRD1T_08220 [Acidimicrobiia bacterium]